MRTQSTCVVLNFIHVESLAIWSNPMAPHFVTGNVRGIGVLPPDFLDITSALYAVPDPMNGTSAIDV
jgi:hypothetical protein